MLVQLIGNMLRVCVYMHACVRLRTCVHACEHASVHVCMSEQWSECVTMCMCVCMHFIVVWSCHHFLHRVVTSKLTRVSVVATLDSKLEDGMGLPQYTATVGLQGKTRQLNSHYCILRLLHVYSPVQELCLCIGWRYVHTCRTYI